VGSRSGAAADIPRADRIGCVHGKARRLQAAKNHLGLGEGLEDGGTKDQVWRLNAKTRLNVPTFHILNWHKGQHCYPSSQLITVVERRT
jgi:hypothetical protein